MRGGTHRSPPADPVSGHGLPPSPESSRYSILPSCPVMGNTSDPEPKNRQLRMSRYCFNTIRCLLDRARSLFFPTNSPAGFKLRLDQAHYLPSFAQQIMKGRKNQFQRNKRTSTDAKSSGSGTCARLRYRALALALDPFIAAQFPGQFAVAHIHRINLFHPFATYSQ